MHAIHYDRYGRAAVSPDPTSPAAGQESGTLNDLALVDVNDELEAQRARDAGVSGLIVIRGGINTDAGETDLPSDNNL